MTEPTFIPAKFIETADGDLIAPDEIGCVRYWPGAPGPHPHPPRVTLSTKSGAVWELYRGVSDQAAIAIRDELKGRIKSALTMPRLATLSGDD